MASVAEPPAFEAVVASPSRITARPSEAIGHRLAALAAVGLVLAYQVAVSTLKIIGRRDR